MSSLATNPMAPTKGWLRYPVLLACGIIAFFALREAVQNLNVHDMDAYWNAALRLRAGEALYVAPEDVHSHALYRYAPWFAYAWVPLTFLPFELVKWAWFALLLAVALWVSVDIGRRGFLGLGLALLLGPFLIWSAALGNVHPLLIAALHFGVQRPSGPVWVAMAGSLKAAPILLLLVYVGRGEWRKVAIGGAIFGALVIPMLWAEGYTTNPGRTISLYGWSPALYVALALFAAGNAVLLARTSWAWTAGGIAVICALPRLLLYDFSFLLVRPPVDADRPPQEARSG